MDRNRRDQLLSRAAMLFRQKGYHATTMKDIAAELEILPGSLYHHIESKEVLLVEIMQRGIEVLLESARPVAASTLPPSKKLRRILATHVHAITGHPDVLAVFLHEYKSVPMGRLAPLRALRDEYELLWRTLIEEGVAQGEFRPLDPRMVTFALLGMLNWLYAWYRPGGPLTPDQIAETYLQLIWEGLSAP